MRNASFVIGWLLCFLVVPLLAQGSRPAAESTVGGVSGPDGTRLQNQIPGEWHERNKAGSDGTGLCVFTSIDHSAHWQNVPQLIGFRDWMTRFPGGGYPEKVDTMIARISQERGLPKPRYLQVEGTDLEVLRRACKSGRVPGVTYGYSPSGRYNRSRISHMVSLVHADDKWFVVLDNNYPGVSNYEWNSPEEFRGAYTSPSNSGWSVILLEPGPPPFPRN